MQIMAQRAGAEMDAHLFHFESKQPINPKPRSLLFEIYELIITFIVFENSQNGVLHDIYSVWYWMEVNDIAWKCIMHGSILLVLHGMYGIGITLKM